MARAPRPDPIKNIPPLDENLVSEKLIADLSGLVGKPLSATHIGDLHTCIARYLIDKHSVDGRRPPAEIRDALEKVRKNSETLNGALNELETMSRGGKYKSAMEHGYGFDTYQFLDQLNRDVEKLMLWTREAVTRIEASGRIKKAHPFFYSLEWLVVGLKPLFETITGEPAKRRNWDGKPYGPFLEFCETIIEAIDPGRIGPEGLSKIISKVIPS
jgi:hypothetical protein